MTVARDWLKTLWPASFKGLPFHVEADDESGGRRKAVHLSPGIDDPYIEDMGADKREFSVSAYVASDKADAHAAALIAICDEPGAGLLVLPSHGPIRVQSTTFKRSRKGDKHGYIALELNFIRDRGQQREPSLLSLANLVFVAADDLIGEISDFCGDVISALDAADYVIGSAVDAIRDVAGFFESIRISAPVQPSASAIQRVAIQSLYDGAPVMVHRLTGVDAALGSAILAAARGLGDGMAAPAARAAFLPLLAALPDGAVDPAATANGQAAARNANAVYAAARIAALAVIAESVARDETIADRAAGITLRADIAELFDAEIVGLDMQHGGLISAVQGLRNQAIDYLSRRILNLAPVITANANVSLPSLVWAWSLYGDPARAGELVARNKVDHPSFMPLMIEALAS